MFLKNSILKDIKMKIYIKDYIGIDVKELNENAKTSIIGTIFNKVLEDIKKEVLNDNETIKYINYTDEKTKFIVMIEKN